MCSLYEMVVISVFYQVCFGVCSRSDGIFLQFYVSLLLILSLMEALMRGATLLLVMFMKMYPAIFWKVYAVLTELRLL